MAKLLEREVTFEVTRSWAMPDVSGAIPHSEATESTDNLEATYYDTDRGTLRRLGVTLRHRTGGDDAGWHLKVPAGVARTEFQSRSRQKTPPQALIKRLGGVLAGQELHPVATISTTRHATRLRDDEGALVLEVADDRVSGTDLATDGEPGRWREIEVELGPAGTEEHLSTITEVLLKADARPAGTRRKLDRVLGEWQTDDDSDLGGLVSGYVREQCTAILLGDITLRDEPEPEPVHRTRVAIRRLRSTLRVFGAMFAAPADGNGQQAPDLELVDADLKWVANLLSPIRDSDILARRLVAELDALPAEEVLGPIRRDIEVALAGERQAAMDAWQAAWTDERYIRVMRMLTEWQDSPPVHDPRTLEGEKVLAKAEHKVDERLQGAGEDPDELHRARKAAKRLRYTADLLGPTVKGAKKVANRAKSVQTLLGDHQDFVVASAFLQRQGAVAGSTPGSNGFTYGLLKARVDRQALDLRRDRLGS